VLILASASRDPSPVPASQTSLAAENTSRWASNRKTTCNREAVGQGETPCAAPPATIQENQRRCPRAAVAEQHRAIMASQHRAMARRIATPQDPTRLESLVCCSSHCLCAETETGRKLEGQRGARVWKHAASASLHNPLDTFRPVTLRRISSKLPRATRSMRHAMHA
jgi:hypothetical protein